MLLSFFDSFKNFFLGTDISGGELTVDSFLEILAGMILAVVIGFLICFVHTRLFLGGSCSRGFSVTLAGITVITAGAVMALNVNIAAVFVIIAVLAAACLRTAAKSPLDFIYLLWAAASGVMVGAGSFLLSVAVCVFVVIALAVFKKGGRREQYGAIIVRFDGNTETRRNIMAVLISNKIHHSVKSENVKHGHTELVIEVALSGGNAALIAGIEDIDGVDDISVVKYGGAAADKKKTALTIFVLASFLLSVVFANASLQYLADGTGETIGYKMTDEVINNPYIGFAPEAQDTEAVGDCSLAFVMLTFADWESEKGVFDVDFVNKEYNLDYYRECGKNIVFRFVCDVPDEEEHMDIPQWLYDETADGVFYDNDYGMGYSPNYANEIFIEEHRKAIEALGEYFGGDDFFTYVELGSLGHWGEWHINTDDANIKEFPSSDISDRYVEPYIEAFKNAKFLMRRPFEAAQTNSFGLYNDLTGDAYSTSEWLDWIENGGIFNQTGEPLAAMPQQWKTCPVGGEFCDDYDPDQLAEQLWTEISSLLRESHQSFLGPHCIAENDWEYYASDKEIWDKGVKEMKNALGYRYGITTVTVEKSHSGEKIKKITLDWVNDGAAPIYFDAEVTLYVKDFAGNVLEEYPLDIDLTKLIEDEPMTTETKLSLDCGTDFKICVGITVGESQRTVQLASSQDYSDGCAELYVNEAAAAP